MIGSLILLSAVALNAQPADAAGTQPLQPLQFLLGHCWAGDLPNGGGHDTHCFEPVYGGKFVRDRHVVHGHGPDYRGETIYGFDPRVGKIVFWYWSSSGVIETGEVEPASDGLHFAEHRLTQPKNLTLRTNWTRIGADRYEALTESKGDDQAWQTAWRVQYVQVARAAQ
jgi:hypothetical protein